MTSARLNLLGSPRSLTSATLFASCSLLTYKVSHQCVQICRDDCFLASCCLRLQAAFLPTTESVLLALPSSNAAFGLPPFAVDSLLLFLSHQPFFWSARGEPEFLDPCLC